MIRYNEILSESIVDGIGLRTVVFLQGCPRHCPGCHNPKLIDKEGGKEVAEEELAQLILAKVTPLHRGITFSGGDPFMQRDALENVIQLIRKRNSCLDIWIYTGYLYEEVVNHSLLRLIDVLVDGPFIAAEKDLRLAWRGSANQRVIHVPHSLKAGKVVEVPTQKSSVILSRAI